MVDEEGTWKVVYPSKTDLDFAAAHDRAALMARLPPEAPRLPHPPRQLLVGASVGWY